MCVLIESTTKQNYKSMYVDKCGFSNIKIEQESSCFNALCIKANFVLGIRKEKTNGSRHMPVKLGRRGSVEQNQRYCKL